MAAHPLAAPGPFTSEQIRDGDRYELENGHPIYAAPAKTHHAGKNFSGAGLLESDPDVEWGGIDVGISPESDILRAPDIAIGPEPEGNDWLKSAPPLIVEYASSGQDERELKSKIDTLLAAGTRYAWVIRLTGRPRVEVYQPGIAMSSHNLEDTLTAPGVLRNPIPVRALFDREQGRDLVLRNLLQRAGYDSLEAVRAEGEDEGLRRGQAELLRRQLIARFGALPAAIEQRLEGASSTELLNWGEQLLTAPDITSLFDPA